VGGGMTKKREPFEVKVVDRQNHKRTLGYMRGLDRRQMMGRSWSFPVMAMSCAYWDPKAAEVPIDIREVRFDIDVENEERDNGWTRISRFIFTTNQPLSDLVKLRDFRLESEDWRQQMERFERSRYGY
jgi:hypothetical protein